ncbi:hypothetical protein BC936DRAFT_142484 [Jimgerdemannia flammicorona]|uniref:Uncharacterized protein n=1 Tax=Jimgerdemannia flammicorona TaxID=994334 RepID=A0A433A0B3_9FUNG|nr:hypothetical protein BC936DRAFT_142484 [Jimgerdemannia flammicorona]
MQVSYTPLALLHNNSFVTIRENNPQDHQSAAQNWASFHITNLKGPIDVVTTQRYLFLHLTQSTRQPDYAFEVLQYEPFARAATIKIIFPSSFPRQSLLAHLQSPSLSPTLLSLSANGLKDWVPVDSATLPLVWPDQQPQQQQQQQAGMTALAGPSMTAPATQQEPDLDDQRVFAHLEELGVLIKSLSASIAPEKLEEMFYAIFPRRKAKITIAFASHAFSHNAFIVQLVLLLTDLDFGRIIVGSDVTVDMILNVAVGLKTMVGNLVGVAEAYKELRKFDTEFAELLIEHRDHLDFHLRHVDEMLWEFIDLIDRKQLTRLEDRLLIFTKTIERLMTLLRSIAVRLTERLKKLEDKEKDMAVASKTHFALAAFDLIAAGYRLYRRVNVSLPAKLLDLAIITTNLYCGVRALSAQQHLALAVERQEAVLREIHRLHDVLDDVHARGENCRIWSSENNGKGYEGIMRDTFSSARTDLRKVWGVFLGREEALEEERWEEAAIGDMEVGSLNASGRIDGNDKAWWSLVGLGW